jgi:hypothetical protein
MRGDVLLIALLLAMLAASTAVALWVWRELADAPMDLHGWLALAFGVVATLLLGVGLMTLVYRSHRRGFDERAGHERDG